LQFLTAPPFAIQPFADCTTIDNPFANALCTTPIPQPFPFTPVKPGGTFDFTTVAPIGMTINEPGFKTPYSHQYNLNVQWEFLKNYLLEVGYVGTTGVICLPGERSIRLFRARRVHGNTDGVASSIRAIRKMAFGARSSAALPTRRPRPI
jgi:hypothetical protein